MRRRGRDVEVSWYDEVTELDLLITASVSGEFVKGKRGNDPDDDILPESPQVDDIIKIVIDEPDGAVIPIEDVGASWGPAISFRAMKDLDFIESVIAADGEDDWCD